jgi:hypothetical protein
MASSNTVFAALVLVMGGVAVVVAHAPEERSAASPVSARAWSLMMSDPDNMDYTLDLMALEYIDDYVKDPDVLERIYSAFWCGTMSPTDKFPPETMTEAALRARAKRIGETFSH